MQILVLPLLAGILAALAVLVVAAARAGRPGPRVLVEAVDTATARRMRRWAHLRLAGSAGAVLVTGICALALALRAGWDQPAWSAACLVAAGAGSAAVGLVSPLGEEARSIRAADLTPRTAGSFGPRWAYTVPAILTSVLVVIMILTAATASSEAGESALAWQYGQASGWVQPYPGWSTVGLLLGLLAVAGGAFLAALRQVAGWPRPMEPGLYPLDDDIRRAVTRALLLGTTGALLGALGAFVSVVAGAWSTALSNERSSAAVESGVRGLSDPSVAEAAWRVALPGGLLLLLIGLILMGCAAVVGRVRRPTVVDPVTPTPSLRGDR